MYRIGHGYDVHKINISKRKNLILGGVLVSNKISLDSHSDGDVVLHSLTDALLGASGSGDIGTHFPNIDKFKNVSSIIFLMESFKIVRDNDFLISNIDLTIVAQIPKILPYSERIKSKISSLLALKKNQVNVKSTTTDTLGFIGEKKGIACHSVAMIYKK